MVRQIDNLQFPRGGAALAADSADSTGSSALAHSGSSQMILLVLMMDKYLKKKEVTA